MLIAYYLCFFYFVRLLKPFNCEPYVNAWMNPYRHSNWISIVWGPISVEWHRIFGLRSKTNETTKDREQKTEMRSIRQKEKKLDWQKGKDSLKTQYFLFIFLLAYQIIERSRCLTLTRTRHLNTHTKFFNKKRVCW